MNSDPHTGAAPLHSLVELMSQLNNDRETLQKQDKSVIAVAWFIVVTAACIVTVVVVVALSGKDVAWQLPVVAAVAEIGAVMLFRFHRGTMREQREIVRMQIYLANLVESGRLLLDPAPTLHACLVAERLEDERKRLGVLLVGTAESQRPFLAKATGNVQQNGASVEFDSRPPGK